MQTDDAVYPPVLVLHEPDTLEPLIELVQSFVRHHPANVQAVATAFVAEGRRFAATSEGRRWRSLLAASELIKRGRLLWYMGGFDDLVVDADDASVVPSDWLALVADAIIRTDLEALLCRRLRREDSNGAANH